MTSQPRPAVKTAPGSQPEPSRSFPLAPVGHIVTPPRRGAYSAFGVFFESPTPLWASLCVAASDALRTLTTPDLKDGVSRQVPMIFDPLDQ